jgi:hypothetical protein
VIVTVFSGLLEQARPLKQAQCRCDTVRAGETGANAHAKAVAAFRADARASLGGTGISPMP